MVDLTREDYEALIEEALREDLGNDGDVTSSSVFEDERICAVLTSKDAGVLAGSEVFAAVFRAVDAESVVTLNRSDGDRLDVGDRVASVQGRAVSVLGAERVAINFLAFLSGIATETTRYVEASRSGGQAVILDTRKTLPGYRGLSKYAVRTGGAQNHRMGLHDMVLLKDNHIDRAGSIGVAVGRVRERHGDRYRIEVECRSLSDVEEALSLGVDLVMLDNMDIAMMEAAVELSGGRTPLEASGNMSLDRIPAVSATGVDYISVGKLTHSVQAFDFSLTMERERV